MSYYDILDWLDVHLSDFEQALRDCRKLHTIDTPMEMERNLAVMTALIEELIDRE